MDLKNRETRMPGSMIVIIIVISAFPFLLNLVGVDFRSAGVSFDVDAALSLTASDLTDAMFYNLSGAFTHTILEWSAFCTAIFIVLLSFVHYKIKHDVVTPIIGMSLFLAGVMDAFHTLAADRLIEAVADNRNLIPFTWAICRFFNALIPIASVTTFMIKRDRGVEKSGFDLILLTSLIFGLLAYAIIHICATSKLLPQTMFPESVITRPYDVAPLIIYAFAGIIVYPRLYRKAPSLFSHALWVSVIPHIAVQTHMAFGSIALFDNHFNIAHFLKIISYLVPFGGLCLDYIQTHKSEKEAQENLHEQLEFASLRAEIGTALTQNARLPDMLKSCARILHCHLNVAFVRIWTLNNEKQILNLRASAGMYTHIDGSHSHVPVGHLKIGMIAKEAKPHLTNSVIDDPRVNNQEWAKQEGMIAFAGYPLIVEDHVVGVMAMFSRQIITKTTINTLGSVADSIALGIEHKQGEDKLKTSEQQSRVILQTALNGIIMINGTGIIETFNSAAEKIFGYKAHEVIGKNINILMPEPYHSKHDGYISNFHKTGVQKIIGRDREVVGKRKDNLTFSMYLAVAKTEGKGTETKFVGSLMDITERKNFEKELIAAKEQAEESNRLKSEFLNIMSHELRTPLTVMLGNLPLLTDPNDLPDSDEIVDIALDIEHSGKHLLTLINDLLDLSKIEAGKMEISLQTVPVVSLIENAISDIKGMAKFKQKNLEFDTDIEEFSVLADPIRIKQILLNLLSNSVKFTDIGGICVRAKSNSKMAKITVRDTGCGMDENNLAVIFEPFRQVDGSSTRSSSGTGLGLAITKKLIELHGGEITVESKIGNGATFTFTIPMDENLKPDEENYEHRGSNE